MADKDSSALLEEELKRALNEIKNLNPGSTEYTLASKSVSELLKCKTDDFKVQGEYYNTGQKLDQDKELRIKELDQDKKLKEKELKQDKQLKDKELDIEQNRVDVMEKQTEIEGAWWHQVDWGRLACGGLFFIGGLATMKFEATGYIFKLKDFFRAIPK